MSDPEFRTSSGQAATMINSGTEAKYKKNCFSFNATTHVVRLCISKFPPVALPRSALLSMPAIGRFHTFYIPSNSCVINGPFVNIFAAQLNAITSCASGISVDFKLLLNFFQCHPATSIIVKFIFTICRSSEFAIGKIASHRNIETIFYPFNLYTNHRS